MYMALLWYFMLTGVRVLKTDKGWYEVGWQGRNADTLSRYFGEDPNRCPFEQGEGMGVVEGVGVRLRLKSRGWGVRFRV